MMKGLIFKRVHIREHEMGLLFREGDFTQLLDRGRYTYFDPLGDVRVEVVSKRSPWLVHESLDVIVKSGLLEGKATVVDLKDHERGLVWIESRFAGFLLPGQYVYWNEPKNVRVEVVDARSVRFEHRELVSITRFPAATGYLEVAVVEPFQKGILMIDGAFIGILEPGRYAFWKNVGQVQFIRQDMRETTLEIAGQDVMTADKVTVRVNTGVTYRVTDPRLAHLTVDDAKQTLYRETQLALREIIGSRELDSFLTDKVSLTSELTDAVRPRAQAVGMELVSVGIRDVILPGDMRDLMNKVMEARRAAEANLITRREETAAIRSQLNTARLLQENPALMRLRELEVLEKVASNSKLNVVLGEKGLADRVVNLL